MNSSQTLELQIKEKAQETLVSLNTLITKLTNVEKSVTSIDSKLKKNTVKSTVKDIEYLNNSAEKTTNSINKLSKSLSLTGAYIGVKKLTSTFLNWMNEAVDYTEQLNLFNVVFKNVEKNGVQTFSKLGKEAIQFQYKLNEAFGTNKIETLYMQGIFQSMGESVGIPDTYSAIMSETMTKMAYDLASLYNKSEKNVAEALRAGVYAGQTKPLRSYGIDVTQQTLQPILDSLGIDDRTVKQMTQAEKEILRYIATLKQGQVAMGDLANTIESPSNQLKIFRQQLVETKVALSSLFMGIFANVLPWFNAFLMVTKEISKALAGFFGIELKDYNSGIASQEDAYVDFGDSVDNATDSVKELKRQTLGFDQINNINENKDSGNSGANLVGGIDQRLLDAIKGYDNGMESVRMKATQIRDSIMEWLGFTKEIDPLTGEVSFKYEGIGKTLSNMWQSFKKLNTQGKILVSLGLVALVSKLFSGTKKLASALGPSGLLKPVKSLLSPVSSLNGYLKVYTNLAGKEGYSGTKKLTAGIKEGTDAWAKNLSIMDRVKTTLVGATGLAVGFGFARDAADEFNETGKAGVGVWTSLAGSLATSVTSGALLGSQFGIWGTAIGAAGGAVVTLISYLTGLEDEQDKLLNKINESSQEIQNYCDEINEYYASIDESVEKQFAAIGQTELYVEELGSLVDANGRVKAIYQSRVEYILNEVNSAYGTEYELINGQIYQNGKLIESNDEIVQSIKDIIEQKKAKILLDANEAKYAKAIEEQANSYETLQTATNNYKEAEKELQNEAEKWYKKREKMLEKYGISYEDFLDQIIAQAEQGQKDFVIIAEDGTELVAYSNVKLMESYKKASDAFDSATENWENNVMTIVNYEQLMEATISGDMDKIEQAVADFASKTGASLSEQLEMFKYFGDTYAKKSGEVNESTYAMYEAVVDSLKRQSDAVENITPELVEAWHSLASQSEEKFLEAFADLDDDIQQEVVNQMYSKGYSISNELQKGINQINPTIKVTADTSQAEKQIKKFIDSSKGTLNDWFGGGGARRNANGGAFYSGSWHNIPQYANGGSPTHGSVFVAGERGAEIVGHINGRTEVLNQSQLASVMYSAIIAGMSQFAGQSNEIDVHVHSDEGVIVDRVNQKIKQTGVFPFIMPTR